MSGLDATQDRARDEASTTCTSRAWQAPFKGETCVTREVFPVIAGLSLVQSIHLARSFRAGVALLYESTTGGSDALTLALIDPVTRSLTSSAVIKSAEAFDATALSYDDVGTLSVAYHTGKGAPVAYVALDGGLSASAPVDVVVDAGGSLLALSSVPTGADGGVGPLGLVPGSVGLAWYAAPAEITDFADSVLHLFARGSAAEWSEVETYGYTSIGSELSLHPNPQAGVVAAGITNTAETPPQAICTWQMAGRVGNCGFRNTLYGLSLTSEPGATHIAYTYEDPATEKTTLNLATDTDGSYTFPLLSTIATLSAAAPGAPAIPRAVMAGGNVTTALTYLEASGRYALAYFTWNASSATATTELVTTVGAATAAGPPFDVTVDGSGVVTIAIFDAASGKIFVARAVPFAPDGSIATP